MVRFIAPGDPVPYLRMTQGQTKLMRIPDYRLKSSAFLVKRRIQKYLSYKEYVRLCACRVDIPAKPQVKVYLQLKIYFRNGVHGDPDNIWKAIADSLFKDDRNVCGSFDFFLDPENPRVEVEFKSCDE